MIVLSFKCVCRNKIGHMTLDEKVCLGSVGVFCEWIFSQFRQLSMVGKSGEEYSSGNILVGGMALISLS